MDFTRRGFLGVSAGGFASLLMHHQWNLLQAQDAAAQPRSCIVLWMDGGPSQLETWDPKPGTGTGGPTQAIATSAPDIRIAANLPYTAKHMHRAAVLRNVRSNEQDHVRAAYLMHTGYKPTAMLTHPAFGSIVSHESARQEGLPAYVGIRGGAAIGAEPGPGFLGAEAAPFVIDRPERAYSAIRALGEGMRERVDLLEDFNRGFREDRPSENSKRRQAVIDSMKSIQDSVFARALDLRDVKPEQIRLYTNGASGPAPNAYTAAPGAFGYGCLLAARLVRAGVRFVEVNLGGWDTHGDNFNAVRGLCGTLDPALAAMLEDLGRDGTLDRTLVVWMGEFGRTPQINAQNGRDHWSDGFSVAMWGGGVAGGRVIGDTGSDGARLKGDAVGIPDLFATMAHLLGLDPAKRYAAHDVGAVRITENGKPVRAVFS